jgi:hypothetical protein
MAALVRPGGRFYLSEFHPFADVFGDETLNVERSYFDRGPIVWDEPGTYADLQAQTEHNVSVEWHHGLGEIVSALIAAGLRIEFLHEHDHTLFPRWPFLVRSGTIWRLPATIPALPLMYSLRATPAA